MDPTLQFGTCVCNNCISAMEYTTVAVPTTDFADEEEGDATAIRVEDTLSILYLIIGALGLVGNSLVLTVVAYYKPMRKRISNMYIANQSVLDLCVSFILIMTTIYQDEEGTHLSGFSGEAYCRLWLTKLPLWGLLVSSSYNLTFLTIERYLAVVHAIWHKMHFNRKKVLITIVLAWVIGLGYNISFMVPTAGLVEDGGCTVFSVYPSIEWQRFNGIFTIFLQFFVPLVILIFCYSRMALVLRSRVQPSDVKPGATAPSDNMSRARKNNIKTLAVVSACFIFAGSGTRSTF